MNIRVTMNGSKPLFELMQSGEKLRDITSIEIIEALEAMTAEVRGDVEAGKRVNADTLQTVMQFTSSLRWL